MHGIELDWTLQLAGRQAVWANMQCMIEAVPGMYHQLPVQHSTSDLQWTFNLLPVSLDNTLNL